MYKRNLGTLFAVLIAVLIPALAACRAQNPKQASGAARTVTDQAATRTVTDHAGNTVVIPSQPKRIASLHTMSTTAMLWELNPSLLIGTATRLKADEQNRPYIRSVEELWGIQFADTGLANYGKFGQDLEQIGASGPDLIVATSKHTKLYDQLAAIAPTLIVDYQSPNLLDIYRDLASWVGEQDKFDQLHTAYQQRLQAVRSQFATAPEQQTVAYVMPRVGKAQYSARTLYGIFTGVAYDLGFQVAPFLRQQFPEPTAIGGNLSAETFGRLDADWLLTTYRNQTGQTEEDMLPAFDDVIPGWRNYTSAYKKQQIVFANREKSFPNVFRARQYVLDELEKAARSATS